MNLKISKCNNPAYQINLLDKMNLKGVYFEKSKENMDLDFVPNESSM